VTFRCPSCRKPVSKGKATCPYCSAEVSKECPHCKTQVAIRASFCDACAWSFKHERVLRRKSGTLRAVAFVFIIVSLTNAGVAYAYLGGAIMGDIRTISDQAETMAVVVTIAGLPFGAAAALGVVCAWGIFMRSSWAPLLGIILAAVNGLLVLADIVFMIGCHGMVIAAVALIFMITASIPLLSFTMLVLHGTLIFVALMVLTKKRFKGQFRLKPRA
jgi:hypothetical protein